MDILDGIYEELYAKKKPTELEKYIIESIALFKKRPIDREVINERIDYNISTYNWLALTDVMKIIAMMPEEYNYALPDCDKYADTAVLEKLLHQIYMMYSILLKQRLYAKPKGRPPKNSNKTKA